MSKIVIKDIIPRIGLPGGSVTITGKRFNPWNIKNGSLRFSNSSAWIEGVSDSTLITSVPNNSITGNVYLEAQGIESNKFRFTVPQALFGGLHSVDNPVIDRDGNIYVTFSGSRGEYSPISVYQITPEKEKKTYLTGITNATSLAIHDNALYVASRFDGKIYRSFSQGQFTVFSQGLGVAFGMAFNSIGELFVGDRSGSIFRINKTGNASFYTAIPQSYIAFHLGFDSKNHLYISNPVHMGENSIYKLHAETGKKELYYSGLSLFHGFVFDKKDNLYLAETKRNESRIIKIRDGKYISTILTGTHFIGVALDRQENLIVSTTNSIYFIGKSDF